VNSLLSRLLILTTLTLGGVTPLEAANHLPQNVVLRDAEIEQTLKDYLTPLFKVSGLDASQLRVFIFNSSEVNAAAGLGYSIFMNTGLILRSDNVGQLIGVLAHETGHLAGRHNERLMNMGPQGVAPMLGALILGGAVSILAGTPEPLLAGLLGGTEVAQNTILAYQRGHEASADQAAFKYLEKLGWSSEGFMEFMQVLHKQELLSMEMQYAYKRTHPFMIDRMRLVEKHCKNSKFTQAGFPTGFETKFQRIKVKIKAFTEQPQRVLQEYPPSDTSMLGRYARAIAYHQMSQTAKSMQEIDLLLTEHPKDPYFLELKGQILFETGQVDKAIALYKQAIQQLPNNGLLKMQLAHMLLESRGPDQSAQVITLLDQAKDSEAETGSVWRLYATAYGRQKQEGMVALMLAEEAAQIGDMPKAQSLADKAIKLLPKTKRTAILRAEDIKSLDIDSNTHEMM
jgi:predicted Zn-dependent protease